MMPQMRSAAVLAVAIVATITSGAHDNSAGTKSNHRILLYLRGGASRGLNGRCLDENALAAQGDPLMALLSDNSLFQRTAPAPGMAPMKLKLRAPITGGKTSPRENFEPTIEDLLMTVRGNRKRKYQSKQFRQQLGGENVRIRSDGSSGRGSKRAHMTEGRLGNPGTSSFPEHERTAGGGDASDGTGEDEFGGSGVSSNDDGRTALHPHAKVRKKKDTGGDAGAGAGAGRELEGKERKCSAGAQVQV
jgi:hypothetical protein